MNRILLFTCFCLFFLYGCKNKKEDFKGTYGMVDFFSPVTNHLCYGNHVLLNVEDSIIRSYETIFYRGSRLRYSVKEDTLIFNNIGKLYRKNEDTYVFEILSKGKKQFFEYKKYPGLDNLINRDKNELEYNKLKLYLNNNLIKGEYMLNGKTVEFTGDGKVKGIEEFSSFTILPRRGLLTFYSDCIIEADNKNKWKYEFIENELVLTKYTNERDEWEGYILSNEQIRLKRI